MDNHEAIGYSYVNKNWTSRFRARNMHASANHESRLPTATYPFRTALPPHCSEFLLGHKIRYRKLLPSSEVLECKK